MKEAFEKIKERLEACISESYYRAACGHNEAGIRNIAYNEALSIVSEVEEEYADKECEYEEHIAPSKEFYYLTACKNRWNGRLHGCRPYCPYCGKKIKVVGELPEPYKPDK